MNVLLVTQIFPNNLNPCLGVFVRQLVDALDKKCRVKVIAPVPFYKWLKVEKKEVIGGIEIYHPPFLTIPKCCRSLYGFLYFFSLLPFILKMKRNFNFDVLNVHWAYPDGFGMLIIAKLIKKPIIITLHNTDINAYTKTLVRRFLIRIALDHADKIIAVSRQLAERIEQIGVKNRNVSVIHCAAINQELFKPLNQEECKRSLGLPRDKRIVLFVGYLIERKGIHYLMEAYRSLIHNKDNNAILIFIGDGPLRKNVQDSIKKYDLGHHIILMGQMLHSALPLWINASDMLCLPSLSEGTPNVIFEAFACGKPVVASRVGGIGNVVDDSRGILVDAQNIEQLEEALHLSLTRTWDSEMIAKYGIENTWERISQKIITEMQDLLVEKESPNR